ncbi:MAG: hypothetical protein VX340_10230 [Pseudomonadota bacterium]|nr:hypothetical protein [Pseudomonadota bacterium]
MIFRDADDIAARRGFVEVRKRPVHPKARQVSAMIRDHPLTDQTKPEPVMITMDID